MILIDYLEASYIWDTLQIEHVRKTGLDELESKKGTPEIMDLFERMSDRYFSIIKEKRRTGDRPIMLLRKSFK